MIIQSTYLVNSTGNKFRRQIFRKQGMHQSNGNSTWFNLNYYFRGPQGRFIFLYIYMFLPTAYSSLTLLHSERPKLYTILAFLSAIGLYNDIIVIITSNMDIFITQHYSFSFRQFFTDFETQWWTTQPEPTSSNRMVIVVELCGKGMTFSLFSQSMA